MQPTASTSSQNLLKQSHKHQAEALLDAIRQIASDLRLPPSTVAAIHLDSSFDNDLNLDSLSRLELFSRAEKLFGVALQEEVMERLETPRELLREIASASTNSDHTEESVKVSLDAVEIGQTLSASPENAETLVDVLYWHFRTHPDRTHIKLISADGKSEEVLTYRALLEEAENVAAGLQEAGMAPRNTVAIMLPTSREYFISFLGILIGGGIPVPIYPPARPNQIEDHLLRHSKIMSNSRAVLLITVPEAKPIARLLKAQAEELKSIVTVEELEKIEGAQLLKPPVNADDIAFLQYTSGSTGTPKGVTLTHRNLLANIRAMGQKAEISSSDVFVSWLPLYHDMGLIGAWMGNLYFSSLLVLMSPLTFLRRPERWLKAIHENRATLTAAPNFAYELCIKRVPADLIDQLKLDSLRAVFNGAEPVSPATLERFSQHFEASGFNAKSLMPVYGLAECSLGLTFPPLLRGPLVQCIERQHFMETGKAIPVSDEKEGLRFVSCGSPVPEHEVRIVDTKGRELPENQQGKVEFRGPSTTSGYYRNPEASEALFHGEWLNSGDMGYISEGELYITGRSKDIIIHAGRNIYPHEVEEAVSGIDGIRKGCVAVFGSQNEARGTEKFVVLAETREKTQEIREQLRKQVSSVVTQLTRVPPDDVVLAPPHSVLKTSSGKIRRAGCRELYEQGMIGHSSRPVWHQLLRVTINSILPELKHRWHELRDTLYGLYSWLVFIPFILITWVFVLLTPNRKAKQCLMRSSGKLINRLLGISVQVNGLANLPHKQPFILLCNHTSYLDGFYLTTYLPLIFSFVAKEELSYRPFVGTFLRAIDTFFVSRQSHKKSAIDANAIAKAANNQNILFFPEGTMTRMPGLLPFQPGAFTAAVEADVAVVPIALRGTRSMLRAGSWLPRRSIIQIQIAPALTTNTAEGGHWQQAIDLRDRARDAILAMAGEPDLSHEQSAIRKVIDATKKKS